MVGSFAEQDCTRSASCAALSKIDTGISALTRFASHPLHQIIDVNSRGASTTSNDSNFSGDVDRSPVQQCTPLLIPALIAMTGAPLQLAEEQVLQRIMNVFLELGCNHRKLTVGTGEVVLSRYRTRMAMIEAGQHIYNNRIALFGSRPAVSIAIDAGTLDGRYFLDIILLAPYPGPKPFLCTAVE
jgi:hypothetical protein